MAIKVVKLGGNEIDSAEFLQAFAQVIAAEARPPIVVHGGGKEIAALQARLGIEPRFIDGLRVTDEESLQIVEMVLGGAVNKRLVRTLNAAGAQAIGLSVADQNLLRREPLRIPQGDLMFVGSITHVNCDALDLFVGHGIVPVVAPLGCGDGGRAYNINADHAALAIARAMNAEALVIVTNVPGVYIDGEVVRRLTATEAERFITSGEIRGGMVPKVRSALEAVSSGVRAVVICDLDGMRNGTGTVIVNQPS